MAQFGSALVSGTRGREFESRYPDQLCDSIAQLDRAFDYESKGRRFESCWGHHENYGLLSQSVFYFLINNTYVARLRFLHRPLYD